MIVATETEAQILETVIAMTPLNRDAIMQLKGAVNNVTRNDAADITRWLWTIQ
jgi:hypothetical protein